MSLDRIKALVDHSNYDYSQKVRDLIEEGHFGEEDIECCILTARSVWKREKDEMNQAVDGFKYTVIGRDTRGRPFYTCGKMIEGVSGKLYYYITAHEADA